MRPEKASSSCLRRCRSVICAISIGASPGWPGPCSCVDEAVADYSNSAAPRLARSDPMMTPVLRSALLTLIPLSALTACAETPYEYFVWRPHAAVVEFAPEPLYCYKT